MESPGRAAAMQAGCPEIAPEVLDFWRRVSSRTAALFTLDESSSRNFHNYADNPIVNVAEYPLDGLPATDAISELMLSAKIPSRVFVVGLDPRDA